MTEMTPAEAVFFAAAALPPRERPAYLARACAGRDDLRQVVERMLAAQPDVGNFLEPSPAASVDASTQAFGLPPDEGTRTFDSAADSLTADYPGKDEHAAAVIAGKYTLVEVIGEGGMGTVWRARQTEPVKRFVAVKLIKAGMDSKSVLARFDVERQALALMDHPNIAKVFDGGLHEYRPFFVMELVKGVPITDYCDHHKLTPQKRLELFVQVCQAIQHAHQKGIIHRDIKPNNVLIALYDDKPVVKVIDFGVAKATGGALTEHTLDTGVSGVVGTPQYMSPEQATFNNLDIDTRSDVYALGVLLYELLAGSPPFARKELEKQGLLEILRVVREEQPPRPSTKLSTADALPNISANRSTEPRKLTGLLRNELDWIVMKALEKDRTRRYETANGFAADVQRYLSGEPVQAHSPTAGYRLRKWVWRNKLAVLIAGGIWLITLTQVGFSTLQWSKAEDSRKAEVRQREKAEELRAEAEERRREADAHRKVAEYRAAAVIIDTAIQGAGEGNGEGLVRLASTLKGLPPEAKALRQGAVTNLLVWGQHIVPAYKRPGGHLHAVSPDGRVGLIALTEPRESWEARDLVTGQQLARLGEDGTARTEPYYEDRRGWVAFSGDGRLAATLHKAGAVGDPTVRLWDTATWGERLRFRPALATYEVRLNCDGTRVATRSTEPNLMRTNEKNTERSTVHLWDARTGEKVSVLDHGGKPVDHIGFSPDGSVVMSASECVVRLWSATDGRLMHTLGPLADAVTLTAYSPSGKTLAVAAGSWVYWWNVADGSMAAPSLALGYTPQPADPDESSRFVFETEDVLIARTWNYHGVSFGRSVGGAVCIRGETKSHALDAVCSDGKFVLTDDRHVYSLSPFRRVATPPGRKFPPEVLAASRGRRYVRVGPKLFDLEAEVPVGPELTEAETGIYAVRAAGIGFVLSDEAQRYWFRRQVLIPDPAALPPDDVMELWAKVLARGHFDTDTGLFQADEEQMWERNRQELLKRAEPVGEFSFPGPVANDPLYWLRQAYLEAKKPAERVPLAERLVAAKPSWQNYLCRANAYASIGRHVEAVREDLRSRVLAKDAYKQNPDETSGGAWNAARIILSKSGRPKEDYELALRWHREAGEEGAYTALALYRLGRSDEALRELSDLNLPRPSDVIAGLASRWAAMAVVSVQEQEQRKQWRGETLPYVIEALCLHTLGRPESARLSLAIASELTRSRPSEPNLYGSDPNSNEVVEEALRVLQKRE